MDAHDYRFKFLLSGFLLLATPLFCDPVRCQEPSHQRGSREVDAKSILARETASDTIHIVREHKFIEETVAGFRIDTTANLDFKLGAAPKLFLTPEELHETPLRTADPIDEALRRRNGISPTVSLGGLVQSLRESMKSSKKKSLQELPIPDDTEIEILKTLWDATLASSSDIYADLDSTIRLTSEDLNQVLEEMTERGFLDRKKISASHEFTVFGLFSFEVSAKNRKNELYVYWPLVSKADLIKYVDARRYLAYAAAKNSATNGRTDLYHKYLIEKLNRLIQ